MSWFKKRSKTPKQSNRLFIVISEKSRTDSHAVFRSSLSQTEKALSEYGWTIAKRSNDGIGRRFEYILSPSGRIVYQHDPSGPLPSVQIEFFDLKAPQGLIKEMFRKIKVNLWEGFRGLLIDERIGQE